MFENYYYNRGRVIDKEEDFYGRKEEIKNIYSSLKMRQSCSIIGPRKIGKTSLLFHLARPSTMRKNNIEICFIRIGFDRLEKDITPKGFFEKMSLLTIKEIAKNLPEKEEIRIMEMKPGSSFDGLIETIKEIGLWKNLGLVYVFDEFELACVNEHLDPTFFGQLRSLNEPDTNIAFLISSKKPLLELPFSKEIKSSPFFNIFVPIPIGLFTEEEALELIIKPSQKAGLSLEDEACFILDLAQRHPLFTQVLCHHLFEAKTKRGILKEEDRKESVRKFLEEISPHLKYYFRDLSDEEKKPLNKMFERLGGE